MVRQTLYRLVAVNPDTYVSGICKPGYYLAESEADAKREMLAKLPDGWIIVLCTPERYYTEREPGLFERLDGHTDHLKNAP